MRLDGARTVRAPHEERVFPTIFDALANSAGQCVARVPEPRRIGLFRAAALLEAVGAHRWFPASGEVDLEGLLQLLDLEAKALARMRTEEALRQVGNVGATLGFGGLDCHRTAAVIESNGVKETENFCL